MTSTSITRRRKPRNQKAVVAVDASSEQAVIPYDENLLERARTQWQFGDWYSLSQLDRDDLQHHPDRAKLALLAAAGQFQVGEIERARQFIRLALDWGCSEKLLLQILAAGVHNSLGRMSALAGQEVRAFRHFELAIRIGTPGSDTRLLAEARTRAQLQDLKMPRRQAAPIDALPDLNKAVSYLAYIKLRLGGSSSVKLGFNSGQTSCLKLQDNVLEYATEAKAPVYLVSNESGKFEEPPRIDKIRISEDTSYSLSGEIDYIGENRPVVWVFQYANGKKIDAQSFITENGRFKCNFRTKVDIDSIAIGIRLAGTGKLNLESSVFKLTETINENLLQHFEEKLEKIKQAHQREVQNSTKQIEACIRLQHYLGPDVILPDLHNWPISPDFGVLLINLVEQNAYDGVIEFGSGTSTLILASALERVARRKGASRAPLLSFDHMSEYAEQTESLLERARLLEWTKVLLAPLAPWRDASGEEFSYYQCVAALQAFRDSLPDAAPKLLVVVDGPPAATGRHARFPALPVILEEFSTCSKIHFLLDDFVRQEEQQIAQRWMDFLNKQKMPFTCTEFANLEKKALLLKVHPVK
jgi:hypothetical protein